MKNETLESLVSKGQTEEALSKLSDLLKDLDSNYSAQVDLLRNRVAETTTALTKAWNQRNN